MPPLNLILSITYNELSRTRWNVRKEASHLSRSFPHLATPTIFCSSIGGRHSNLSIHTNGLTSNYFATTRLFFTEKTFGTWLARKFAKFLSISLSTTPSSVTFPFFTMM
jgi:hypothetical protein